MPEPVDQTARFAPEPHTVAAVRRFLRDCLADSDPDLVHDAAVLASEVASNVVEHARTDYEVRVRLSGQILRVEIADGSSVVPAVQELAADADHGRGLHLLAGLAHSWGVEETPTGKDVWFELRLETHREDHG
jgi:anti-sigma regulatory factor (Ser/Thr protein kinase)